MRLYRRFGAELLGMMPELDPEAHGLSAPELRRATGWNASTLRKSLIWLEDTEAVRVILDEDRRKRWVVVPEDVPPADLDARNSALEDVLASLTS